VEDDFFRGKKNNSTELSPKEKSPYAQQFTKSSPKYVPPIPAPSFENTQRYSEKSSPKQQTQRILKAQSPPPLVRESTDYENDYMEVQVSPKGKGVQ